MSTTMMFANGNRKLAWLFAAALTLSACSGGGGGGGSTAPAPTSGSTDQPASGGDNETPAPAPTVPEQPEVIEATSDLVVADDFVFSSSYTIDLDVDVSARISDSVHLVVCRSTDAGTPSAEVDYSDCMIRTDLDAGAFAGKLKLTGDTTELAAALWFYDEARDAEVHSWIREDSAESFVIR